MIRQPSGCWCVIGSGERGQKSEWISSLQGEWSLGVVFFYIQIKAWKIISHPSFLPFCHHLMMNTVFFHKYVTEMYLEDFWEQEKTVSVGVWCSTETPIHYISKTLYVGLLACLLIVPHWCFVLKWFVWKESRESKLSNDVWYNFTLRYVMLL